MEGGPVLSLGLDDHRVGVVRDGGPTFGFQDLAPGLRTEEEVENYARDGSSANVASDMDGVEDEIVDEVNRGSSVGPED